MPSTSMKVSKKARSCFVLTAAPRGRTADYTGRVGRTGPATRPGGWVRDDRQWSRGVGRSTAPRLRFAPLAGVSRAPVAQLDRVSASEAEGRGFESRRARHQL